MELKLKFESQISYLNHNHTQTVGQRILHVITPGPTYEVPNI